MREIIVDNFAGGGGASTGIEMADVYICLELLKQMYEITDSDVQEWIDFKQKRAVKRIESEG